MLRISIYIANEVFLTNIYSLFHLTEYDEKNNLLF